MVFRSKARSERNGPVIDLGHSGYDVIQLREMLGGSMYHIQAIKKP